MALLDGLPEPSAPWHALLAPLPDDAVPRRQPIAPGTSEGSTIAGLDELVLELSAGAEGLRALLVVLDREGNPTAASDHVLYRIERAGPGATQVEYQHASIGGRFEDDGSFKGTRWRSASVESEDGEELESASEPSGPSEADIVALRALVEDLVRRAPASGPA